MKWILVILCFATTLAHAQDGDAVFVVNKKFNISIVPKVDTLLTNKTYHFAIKGIALKDISAAVLKHGKVVVNDTDLVLRTNKIDRSTLRDTLLLFTNVNGKQVQIYSKAITLVKVPDIVPSLLGTNALNRNVAIHWWLSTRQLYVRDTIPARIITGTRANVTASTFAPVFKQLEIRSFRVQIECNGMFQQYIATSGVTPEMEKALKEIKPGCTIKLLDIWTYSSEGIRIVGPYNIYVSP
jgi:hypothetical protein